MSTPPPSPGGETVAASVDFSEPLEQPLEPLADDWVALASDTDVEALDTVQRSALRAKGGYFLREWLSEQTTLLLGATPRRATTKFSVLLDVLQSEDYTATLRSWAPAALDGDIRAAVRVLRLYPNVGSVEQARVAWRSIRKMGGRHKPPSRVARPSKLGGRPSKLAVAVAEPAAEVPASEDPASEAPPLPPSPLYFRGFPPPAETLPETSVPFVLSPMARSIDLDLLFRCAPASPGPPGCFPSPLICPRHAFARQIKGAARAQV